MSTSGRCSILGYMLNAQDKALRAKLDVKHEKDSTTHIDQREVGKLTPAALAALNRALSDRIKQLEGEDG